MAKPGSSEWVAVRKVELEALLARTALRDRVLSLVIGLIAAAGAATPRTWTTLGRGAIDRRWSGLSWVIFLVAAVVLVPGTWVAIRTWRRRKFWWG